MLPTVRNVDTLEQTDKFLPLKMDGLTPEMVRKAEEELNETPEKKKEALKKLKHLINEEVDFEPLMDENFLLRFLRAKKFDPKKAVQTMKNFYAYKVRYSGSITDRLPSEIKEFVRMNAGSILPQRDQDGSAIGIAKASCFDLNKVSYNDSIAAMLFVIELLLQSEATQICGLVVIFDHTDMSLRKTIQLASPTGLYRLIKAIQDCVPIRIKAVHVVNEPLYFTIIANGVKPFMSQKIKNRFYFHGKHLENFYKEVPQEILPSELGGYQGPLDCKTLAEECLQADNYFSKLFKYGFKGRRAENLRRGSAF